MGQNTGGEFGLEVKEELNVSAKEFFDMLTQSVLYDINASVEDKITAEQIVSGYQYEKNMKNKMGSQGAVRVTIKRFEVGKCYEASFLSAQGMNGIRYQIEERADGGITVCYREEFEGKNRTNSFNYRLMAAFYKRSSQKRMSQMLRSMESYVIAKRAENAAQSEA